MPPYKHTQIGYLMIVVTLAVLALFAWAYITASNEPPSVDSGTNFAISAVMVLILLVLASFSSLTITVDQSHIRIKFGYGLFRKCFAVSDIASVKSVKNHWYYGWGIRVWFWPYMWIYNVSGFDAVEIVMKNGKKYRIGTDDPQGLEMAVAQGISR